VTAPATDLLGVLETYYDAAPRPFATTEEVGPFTVFVPRDRRGCPYYARPRLGLVEAVAEADVVAVRARQRELGVPEAVEWVHQTTPSLLDAARSAGMVVHECPLMVLPGEAGLPHVETSGTAAVLTPDAPELPDVIGAVDASFSHSDQTQPADPTRRAAMMRDGTLVMVGGYDARGRVVGGGSHSPRGETTELTGIAVLPRARRQGIGAAITRALVADARERGTGTVFLSAQDDAVARIYARVGFVRVGTACVAEAPQAEGSQSEGTR
jgi:GNAT superfamily N-acetyltransferase